MIKEQKWNKITVIIITVLLLISVGLNTLLIMKRTDTFPSKRILMKDAKSLHIKLTKTLSELHKYEGISKNIDKIIEKADAKLAEKEKQISKLLRDKNRTTEENMRLQTEIDSLQSEYLTTIDSLLVERQKNHAINSRLENMNEMVNDLRKQLGYSKELISENFRVEPQKSNKLALKQSTSLAKRASELKICYDIIQNKAARSGPYDVYIVITSPDGEVLKNNSMTDDELFTHPEYNKKAKYSQKESIQYQNQKVSFCHSFIPENELSPGLYVAELFTSDNKLGMVTFTLR